MAVTAEALQDSVSPPSSDLLLFDFSQRVRDYLWYPVTDAVMGGMSQSFFRASMRHSALFEGTLSLENNGGFASARTAFPACDLSTYDGLSLRVYGDGKRYRLRIYTEESDAQSIAYQGGFSPPKGSWSDIRLPFSELKASLRGREVPEMPALDRARISSLGLMIADRQRGNFKLEISSISAYACK